MASKLTSADILEITRQSDVTSKPLRDNFTNTKNKINEVIDDLAAVAIGTTNAETTAARPYHTNLKERLDNKGALQSGGVVTVNGVDTAKVDVTEFTSEINGIDVKVAAATSAAISAAAAGKHRIDVVVGNSSNAFVIVTGAETADDTTDPVFPSIASTQHSLAAIYIDDGAVDVTNTIYTLKVDTNQANFYIKQAATWYQGIYNCNNLIIDAAITLDYEGTASLMPGFNELAYFGIEGNLHTTSSASFVSAGSQNIYSNGNVGVAGTTGGAGGAGGGKGLRQSFIANYSGGLGGVGATWSGGQDGGGGGGGGSIWVAGGAGGVGAGGGGAGAGPIGTPSAFVSLSIFFRVYGDMDIDSDFTITGAVGGVGQTAGGAGSGGAGGASSGNVILICNGDININCTVALVGGAGGVGGADDGGGGGGGAGGNLIMIYKTITDNATHTGTAGAGGVAPGSGTNGTAGTAGSEIKVDYTAGTAMANSIFNYIGA